MILTLLMAAPLFVTLMPGYDPAVALVSVLMLMLPVDVDGRNHPRRRNQDARSCCQGHLIAVDVRACAGLYQNTMPGMICDVIAADHRIADRVAAGEFDATRCRPPRR